MTYERGDLIKPCKAYTWVGDPADVRSPVLYEEGVWPAVLLDGETRMGHTDSGNVYLYKRLLLSTGLVIEVYPSFLEMCTKIS